MELCSVYRPIHALIYGQAKNIVPNEILSLFAGTLTKKENKIRQLISTFCSEMNKKIFTVEPPILFERTFWVQCHVTD
jgi:hypothetical protein